MRRLHVFDELRASLGLRKHSHGTKRKLDEAAPLFFPSTKGWQDMAPPKTLPEWARGPLRVLEALIDAPANSLDASKYEPGTRDHSDTIRAHLELLRAVILAEGGLLPTAKAIAAERGRDDELEPDDLSVAASRVTGGGR